MDLSGPGVLAPCPNDQGLGLLALRLFSGITALARAFCHGSWDFRHGGVAGRSDLALEHASSPVFAGLPRDAALEARWVLFHPPLSLSVSLSRHARLTRFLSFASLPARLGCRIELASTAC